MEILQIISVCAVILASIIPLYFVFKVKTNREVLLSSILLFSALIAYGIGVIVENFAEDIEGPLFQICLVAAVIGTMASYIIIQKRHSHSLIGGMFGMVMLSVFGALLIGEIVGNLQPNFMPIKYFNSFLMIGFGLFIITRYFWLRNDRQLKTKLAN